MPSTGYFSTEEIENLDMFKSGAPFNSIKEAINPDEL